MKLYGNMDACILYIIIIIASYNLYIYQYYIKIMLITKLDGCPRLFI